MTPDRARKEAIRLLGLIRDGQDPARDREAAKAMPTVAELCDAYLEAIPTLLLRRAGRPKKESTLVTDRSRIAYHIKPLLGGLRVGEVTPAHVETFMHRVASGATALESTTKPRGASLVRGGRGAAARTVGLLGAIFAYAQKRGFRTDNPVRGVVRFADGRRERRLSDAEYAALGNGLALAEAKGVSPTGLAALRLLVLTGWRKSEATSLRWAELDLPRRTARLGDTKSGASIRPLAQAVVELLLAQPRTGSPYVFPARVEDRSLQGLPRMWEGVRTLAALPADVTLHVLRHSFASLAADLYQRP
jgi:integrase